MKRIDIILWETIVWATRRPRTYLWRWWQYGLKEPLVDPFQANTSLSEVCGYKLEPSKPMTLAYCRPGFRRWRFGFYVYAMPRHHKSKHWQMYWCRWIDDPFEFYLVRSALAGPIVIDWGSSPKSEPESDCNLMPISHNSIGNTVFDRVDINEILQR